MPTAGSTAPTSAEQLQDQGFVSLRQFGFQIMKMTAGRSIIERRAGIVQGQLLEGAKSRQGLVPVLITLCHVSPGSVGKPRRDSFLQRLSGPASAYPL